MIPVAFESENTDRTSNLNKKVSPSLLMVEDDLSLVQLLNSVAEALRPQLNFEYATTGAEALNKLRERALTRPSLPYDLVITDIFLEGDDTGLALWIDCQKNYPDMPVLVTSSLPVGDYLSILSGFSEQPIYVKKPFTTAILKNIIDEYL